VSDQLLLPGNENFEIFTQKSQ